MNILYGIIFFLSVASNKVIRQASLYLAAKDGLKIGGAMFVGAQAFGSEPYLIKIGSQYLIKDGVKSITRDGSIQVPLIEEGAFIGDVCSKKSTFGRIDTGNNVFVRVGSVILPDTKTADNFIAAAGHVVKGVFPVGVVIGSISGRIICKIGDYYNKNKERLIAFIDECKGSESAIVYFLAKNKMP